jgi:RHS repeat-associated protein
MVAPVAQGGRRIADGLVSGGSRQGRRHARSGGTQLERFMFPRLSARLRARRRLIIAFLAAAVPAATILPFLPPMVVEASGTPTLLGEQNWYTLDRHQLWDKADLAVNVASGDLIFHEKDLDIPGIGANNLILERYYNSISNGAGGGADFGSDWVMTTGGDVKLTIGTSITYQGPSSFQQVFTGTAPNWTTPAGMDATLYGPNGSSQYTLTYHDDGQVLTFNSSGQLLKNADRNGNTITYSYNGNGTLSQITDATNRTVSFTYGGNGNVATMVDNSLGRTYTYTINGSHNLTNYADPANPAKNAVLTYDTLGKHELVDIKDPAGNGETKLTYDTNHRVTELQFVYDSTGDTYNRIYTYNSGTGTCTVSPAPAGNTVVTDENGSGHTTTYCWDSSGRVVQTIDAVGDTSTTVWNSDDKPTSITDPRGYTTTYAYTDSFAPNENLTSVTQPAEPTVSGAKTTYTYGASTNHYAPTQVVNPDGTLETYTYDANGNPSTMVNGLSSHNTVTTIYGSNGELLYTLDAKGVTASGCYDGSTPMTECYSYDTHGALTKKVTPTTTENYVNDAAGRVSTYTLGNYIGIQVAAAYTYDNDDRGTQVAYGNNPSCPTASGSCTTLQYDADGNLQTLKDQTGTTTYAQDKLNRLASEAESLTGSQTCTTTPTACTTYTLDGVGNLKTLVNGAGTTYYYYDNANRPSSMKDPAGNTITFYVDADGNRYQTTYPNGTYLNSQYDNADHLSNVNSTTATTTLTSLSYSYISGTTDTNQRYYQVDNVGSNSWAYGYDQLDRLSQTIPPGSSTWQYSSYDANSNNCGRTDGSACQGGSSDPFQYNGADQLSYQNGLSYTYASDGSMATWSNSTDHGSLTPNLQGQLGTEYHGSSIYTNYTYRGVGQGDRATASSPYFGNQTWTSDLLGVSTELNTAQSACPCYYVHDPKGLLVEVIETTGTYYPVFDGDGSIIALTNSSGSVVDTWTYSPTGLTSSTGSVYEPWQFQGQFLDQTGGTQSNETTGNEQYHQGVRYREAGWMAGTWGQQDPLDSPFVTQGWNRYNYAGQDPVNLTDPNGMGGAPACGSVGRPCNPNVFGAGFLNWATDFVQESWGDILSGGVGCATGALAGADQGASSKSAGMFLNPVTGAAAGCLVFGIYGFFGIDTNGWWQ